MITKKQIFNTNKVTSTFKYYLALIFAIIIVPQLVSANGTADVISAGLCKIVAIMNGNFARAIISIFIFGFAFAMFTGKIELKQFLILVTAAVIMIAGPAILSIFTSSANTACATSTA